MWLSLTGIWNLGRSMSKKGIRLRVRSNKLRCTEFQEVVAQVIHIFRKPS